MDTEPAGNWRIERQLDRITGKPISSAYLVTRSVSNGAIAFAPPAQMQLACFKERPTVLFSFQFKVGSNRNGEFGYRFDEKPGREPKVRYVENFKEVVIEDPAEVAQFVDEMATSNVLYVRIRALNAARSSAEFRLDGARAAIASAYAGCPVASAARASALPPAGHAAATN
jgi:hypothetical protein